uniref:Uncharacterized protein n=1 Tax=Ditylenchus dipsaci TaxID=166011 RepID=A0A915E1C9_9BILA
MYEYEVQTTDCPSPASPSGLTINIKEASPSEHCPTSPAFKVTPVPCSSSSQQPSPSSPSLRSNSEQCLYNVNSRQNIITNDQHQGEEESYNQVTIGNNSLAGKLSNALAESFGQTKKRKLFNGGPYNGHVKLGGEPNGWLAGLKRLLKVVLDMRQSLILVLTPLLLMPLVFSERSEYKCAFCVGIMAVYWTTEVMPLAVTALLPVVLFPLTGVLSPKTVSKEFLNDTNFLFIGGLIVATAVEKCDLHERLALRVLTLVGSKPKWIMFGFMVTTAVLSMFISNTATTAMMVPIGESVIQLLIQKHKSSTTGIGQQEECRQDLIENGNCQAKMSINATPGPRQCRMAKGLMLSICFAANIGGIGTITGTPPNLVMVGMLSTLFPHVESTGIHYLSWMAFAVPLMVLCLLSCWLILLGLFIRSSSSSTPSNDSAEQSLSRLMQQKYAKLAPMNFSQKAVSICFFMLLALWIGRDPQVVPGFGDLLPIKEFYTDATSAMLIAIILFILPTESPSFSNHRKESGKPVGRLMDWPTMQKRFPWSVVLLLGGGFALAAGVKESGLSTLMGDTLSEQLSHSSPTWALQLVVIAATMVVTNICSNTVTASIFIPIVATLATEAGIHPLWKSTNAIAFSSKGKMLKVSDMILSGFLVSLTTMAIVMVYLSTFTPLIFPSIDANKTEWLVPTTTSPPESLLFADVVQQLLNDNITSSVDDVLKIVQ